MIPRAFYFTVCNDMPAITFRVRDQWVAIGLVYYMVAQGDTRKKAEEMLTWALNAQPIVDQEDGKDPYWNTQAGLTNFREYKE